MPKVWLHEVMERSTELEVTEAELELLGYIELDRDEERDELIDRLLERGRLAIENEPVEIIGASLIDKDGQSYFDVDF